jgi:transcriptional regulator GlxA family with amidase domain
MSHPPLVTIGPLMVTRRDTTRGRGRRKPDILKAVEMIRAEACDGLTAAKLASRFLGTRRLFDLRFREAMGHPAHDEILHVRLERALSLLARPDVPIGAIPFQCGFQSEIALHKLFVRRYGVSMREWRKEHV